MYIKKLSLKNFRNFEKKEIEFGETTIIVGPNAAGKTNILEAINLLSTGKSFRAGVEQEMIRNTEDLARVIGKVNRDSETQELEIVVTRGVINDAKVVRKKLSVNNNPKRFYDFVGELKTVLFGPWDVDLVTTSPSVRRRFLDTVCSQVDREYRRSLLSYEKGVRQRNKLLQRIREGEAKRSQLMFWDQLLIKNGEYLSRGREEFIGFTNLTEQINPLSGGEEQQLSLEYDRSTISPARLQEYAEEEVAAGATLVGPHRDDFIFKSTRSTKGTTPLRASFAEVDTKAERGYAGQASTTGIESRNMAIFGSRGEQRMAVLWLKLAELSYIEGKTGERPVLLLDDIFSELDHKHRDEVMATVGKQQTIITTADPHTIEGLNAKAKIVELT